MIFLGEIRDTESAEIGVNAALTGHLLLSQPSHANDAATAIPRLLDMGIERFLTRTNTGIGHRAGLGAPRVRTVPREASPITDAATKKLLGATELSTKERMCGVRKHRLQGAHRCMVIKNSPEMQELIIKSFSQGRMATCATAGTLSMFEDGLDKVRRGITTLEGFIA